MCFWFVEKQTLIVINCPSINYQTVCLMHLLSHLYICMFTALFSCSLTLIFGDQWSDFQEKSGSQIITLHIYYQSECIKQLKTKIFDCHWGYSMNNEKFKLLNSSGKSSIATDGALIRKYRLCSFRLYTLELNFAMGFCNCPWKTPLLFLF